MKQPSHLAAACSSMLVLGVTGCRHTAVVPLPPPPPVATVSVPPPTHHLEIRPTIQLEGSEPLTLELLHLPLPRLRPKPMTARQLALLLPTGQTPAIVLGVLTQGAGTDDGASLQATQALLQTQQVRLQHLPSSVAHSADIAQARLFLRHAGEALHRHDIDGAHTLAIKAKVLLDDTTK